MPQISLSKLRSESKNDLSIHYRATFRAKLFNFNQLFEMEPKRLLFLRKT